MHLISRHVAIDLLLENTSKLRVTTSYQKRTLDRFLTNAWEQDRHMSIGDFSTPEKTYESFEGSNLVFFEIDDYELKGSDKNHDLLKLKLAEHIKIVSDAMKEFVKRSNDNRSFNWPDPLLCTYSGNKSFHLLYKFDRFLSKEEYSLCREQISFFERLVINTPYEQYPNARKLDFQVIFCQAHCPRFPCDIQQDNRLPQFGYVIDSNPNYHQKHIDTKDFLSIVNTHKSINNIINKFSRKENPAVKNGGEYVLFSKETLEDILEITLVPTKNSESKFLITCINPDHHDTNRSAFITNTGFVYCTVCCKGGKKWISRVLSNSTIIHNKDK